MWLIFKDFYAVYKRLIVQHYSVFSSSSSSSNQISFPASSATERRCLEWGAQSKENQKQCRYFSRQSYIFGCEYSLLMPALRSGGGNSLNISVTPAVGLSSLCFVHLVEKQQKKKKKKRCVFPHVEVDSLHVDRDNGEYGHGVFIVKAE